MAEAGAGGGVGSGDAAAATFRRTYGRAPEFSVRAPGRVNLIGEHVDYHDLPVLPFAIERAVTVLFAPAADGVGSGRVRVASAAPGHAGAPDAFDLGERIDPLPPGDWRNYPRAAAAGLTCARGVDALVFSDLPMGAGLGSSSALVVATGLALARADRIAVEAADFAARMARAERFVGTEGGGMDQAACVLSRAGFVTRIAFAPLAVSYVPFPSGLKVLVADSGEVAEKSGAAREAYNTVRRAGEEEAAEAARAAGHPGVPLRDLLARVGGDAILDLARGAPRLRHVVTEAARVAAAEEALVSSDRRRLGALLTASHASLRDDYGVSTPTLDRLVDAALAAGALGARLTGAGFGGSVIALADDARAHPVLEALESSGATVLAVRPSGGAQVEVVSERGR